jgi:hypothetical protein
MITKFYNFLNEYTGPYRSAGFKLQKPEDRFKFNIFIKYGPKNEKIIKNILSKYDIYYDVLKLYKADTESGDSPDAQKLDLTFLSYNEYEAGSIISSILFELNKNSVAFDPTTIEVNPLNKTEKKPIGFDFPKK